MDTPAREFPMSFGRTQRAVWIGLLVLFVLINLHSSATTLLYTLLYFTPLVLVIELHWVLAPAALTIERDALCLRRRYGWTTRIPLTTIAAVESAPNQGLPVILWHGALVGAGTLFWDSAIGCMWSYATRRDTAVLIRRRGGFPILVTPDDPGALVAAIRAASGAAPEPAPR
jgi:hypothetical protein